MYPMKGRDVNSKSKNVSTHGPVVLRATERPLSEEPGTAGGDNSLYSFSEDLHAFLSPLNYAELLFTTLQFTLSNYSIIIRENFPLFLFSFVA